MLMCLKNVMTETFMMAMGVVPSLVRLNRFMLVINSFLTFARIFAEMGSEI